MVKYVMHVDRRDTHISNEKVKKTVNSPVRGWQLVGRVSSG